MDKREEIGDFGGLDGPVAPGHSHRWQTNATIPALSQILRCVTPLERLFVLLVHHYRPLSAKKVRLRAIFRFLEKVDFKMFFFEKNTEFFFFT
jgi:hypothetical protein